MSNSQNPSPESGDASLDAELAKAELRRRLLECAKLEKEMKEYARPWWTRTAYLAVFVPTLIALLGLIQGYRSGYFDVQALRQEVRERELKLEQRDVSDQEKKLDARKTEIARLKSDIDSEKNRLDQEHKNLKTQLQHAQDQYNAKLASARADYDAQSRVLTEKAELASVDGYLDGIFKNGYPHVDTEAPLALIDILQKRDAYQEKRIQLVRQAVDDPAHSAGHRAVLLFVLYRATHDRHWRDRLFSMVREAVNPKNGAPVVYGPDSANSVISGVAHSFWPDADRTDVAVFIAHLLDNRNEEVRLDLLWVYFELGLAGRTLDDFRKTHLKEYITATAVAREEFLRSTGAYDSRSLHAGSALQALSPQGFLTATAKLLTSEAVRRDGTFAADLLSHTSYITVGTHSLDKNIYPHSLDPSEWEQWLKTNQHFTDLWLEPGLNTFEHDPALLDQALHAWLMPPKQRASSN